MKKVKKIDTHCAVIDTCRPLRNKLIPSVGIEPDTILHRVTYLTEQPT